MRVPLARPTVPALTPLPWPTLAIAIFGVEERALADAIVDGWEGETTELVARLDVALRHASGAHVGESHIDAHPDALAEAIAGARGRATAPTVGVGAAFAVGVRAELVVFSGPVDSLARLPEALRVVARRASLILEDPRLEVARELGRRLARLESRLARPRETLP